MAEAPRKTRADQAHIQEWVRPENLQLPSPPSGMKWRWVRHELDLQDDAKNVHYWSRQGYEPVQLKELESLGGWAGMDALEDGKKHSGTVRCGDLLLFKVPLHIAEQRRAYYEGMARRQQQAVDHELDKLDSESMPVTRESRTTVTRGRPAFDEESA